MPTHNQIIRIGLAIVALATLALAGGTSQPGRPGVASAQTSPPLLGAKAEIGKVLDDQTLAWNRGDLDGFLDGYWRSPQVVFMSGGTRNDGFDAMRDRYKKRYQSDGKAMGQLSFTGLEIEPLSPDAAFVRGRFNLTMPDGTHPTGLFTLIVRRIDGAWKIIHDHTSVAEPTATPGPTAPPTPSVPKPATPG